jgi:type I restriction enzyme, S subunit
MKKSFNLGFRSDGVLGFVPEAWDVVKIGSLGKVVTGTTPSTKVSQYYSPPQVDFIAPADLGQTRLIYNSENKISHHGLAVIRPLPKDAVMCVCIGSSIGKVGMTYKEPCATNQQINSIICNERYVPGFIYYLLSYFSEYWRGFANFGPVPILSKGRFEAIDIIVPRDRDVQQKIATILELVQRAIEQQERLIALTTELKKALLHKLFTEGLRGEPQKQTEIGPVPESWEKAAASEVFERVTDGTHDTPQKQTSGHPLVTSKALKDGRVLLSEASYLISNDDFTEIARRSGVGIGDILFSMIGTVGEVAFVENEPTYAIKNVGLFKCKDKSVSRFCFHYFQSPHAQNYIQQNLSGTSQKYLPLAKLRQFPMLLPQLSEMLEFATILDIVGQKIELATSRRRLFSELFQVLLHQLMTAQIRVKDLDLSLTPLR